MEPLTLGDQLNNVRIKCARNFAEMATDFSSLPPLGSGQGWPKFREVCSDYLELAGFNRLTHADQLPETKKKLNVVFGLPQPDPPYGPQELPNGTFATDEFWTLGDGWSISNGMLHCDGTQAAETTACSLTGPLFVGEVYRVTMVVDTVSAGSFTPRVGPTLTDGTPVTTAGYQTQEITGSTGANQFCFVATADFVGSIEFVSMNKETAP